MKPRFKAIVDGLEMVPSFFSLTRAGYQVPDTSIITVENTDCKMNKPFFDYLPSRVLLYYRDEVLPELSNWMKIFDGLADLKNPKLYNNQSTYTFECRSLLCLLDDDWTHKWENTYLKQVINDLVSKYFTLDFQGENFYIGDHLMENKSRLEEVNEFADLFGYITFLKPDGKTFYFGPYEKGKQWIYQFLNNYPRTQDLINANLMDLDIKHMTGMFPYAHVVVEKKSEDKVLFQGKATSSIPRATGNSKIYNVDHKYLTSNAMAQSLAEYILWKMERQYITVDFETYNIPFLEPEHVLELTNLQAYDGFYWIKSVTTTMMEDTCTSRICCHSRNPKERFS
jgi:hypothetical protein